MKVLKEGVNIVCQEKTMKHATFFQVFVMFSIVCSIAQATVDLTVNGNDPSVLPLEFESSRSIEITLADPNSMETSYDLTLSAMGGVFLCDVLKTSSESKFDIQTSDLDSLDTINFEFSNEPGVAVISLTTNQALTIGQQTVPPDTKIYQLILFDMDEKVVIFGINYDSLSYKPPVEQQVTPALIDIEAGPEEVGVIESYSYSYETTGRNITYQTFSDPNQNPDLDNDNVVNFKDFAIFSGNWLESGTGLEGDFDQDGTVDVNDLMHIASYWLYEVRTILYVDGSVASNGDGSSWANAYKYLKDALEAASPGHYEIWVANGTYKPGQDASHTDGDPTQTFILPANVSLLGGFHGDPNGETSASQRDISENPTILSGNANGGNCAVIVTASENNIIDSFKITGASSEAVSATSYAPLIRHCVIYENGAGVTSGTGMPIIDNCTIVNNTGYAVKSEDAHATITNSILWGNNGASNEYQNCQVSYSCIEDGCIGSTNIAWFPYFEDVSNNNYRLKSYSPCIDAADPEGSYDKEPSGGGGRLNMGAYGNTAGAALKSSDTDSDGLPDDWEMAYFGTISYGPDDDNEDSGAGDGFTNLIEYQYGYDPNAVNTESAAIAYVSVSTSKFDPANSESVYLSVYLNKAETITVNLRNADDATEVYSITQAVSSGNNIISWDGTVNNNGGAFVREAFYNIEIENSSSAIIWNSPVIRKTTPLAGPTDENVIDVDFLNIRYQNLPVKITSDRTDWHRRTIEVRLLNDTVVKQVADDALLEGGGTLLEWSGHWRQGAFENRLCHDDFVITFGTPTAINVGAIQVKYRKPISNLSVNPYRIVVSHREFAAISYNLAYDGEVTVNIYDIHMNLFRSMTEQQSAGSNTILWDGTNADGKYIRDEGAYIIELLVSRFNEEEKSLGTVLIFQ